MKTSSEQDFDTSCGSPTFSRWRRILISAGLVLVAVIGLVSLLRPAAPMISGHSTDSAERGLSNHGSGMDPGRAVPSRSKSSIGSSAEAIVGAKLAHFARSRRELAYALARRHGVEVPDDVERFFDAVASGNWAEIEVAFTKINGGDSSAGPNRQRASEVDQLWPAIIDAYGVAEQVHEWPAQKLLDYGNAVLSSLRPGMVYVGGTDNGRWIPELLNDTSDGEHHIIVTQNALADATYLDYLQLQYHDGFAVLSQEDSQRAFQEYVADAQSRFKHDQDHPDEPKRVRPGEDIRVEDGKTQISGQVAVMAINEKLLQLMMAQNPELSFALQESFPLKSTYADAMPLGPLMELRAQDTQNSFTAERASQTLDYWRNAAQQVLADPDASSSPTALKSYSHDTVSAAHLLAAHNFGAEAEQAYRLASQLWPSNPESTYGLAELLARNGRNDEARQVLDDFTRKNPGEQEALQRARANWQAIGNTETSRP
jgi:hypothetical protein